MKPKNNFQRLVAENIYSLQPLTEKQKAWGYDHTLYKYAHRAPKGTTYCMECGHKFHTREGLKQCVCPNCRKLLKVENTQKRTRTSNGYFCVATTCKGLQVLRYFLVRSRYKKGCETETKFHEVVQRWINKDGKTATTAMMRSIFSMYVDAWVLYSDLELRKNCRPFEYIDGCAVYPSVRAIPAIKRNGFKRCLHNISPASLFEALLTKSPIETLFKAGQYALAKHFVNSRNIDENLWTAAKIAMRNKYAITEPTIWCDYIDCLCFLGKDIRNAKFVCPADLKTEHDRAVAQRRRIREQEEIKKKRKKALENEEKFKELKSKFFGIQFTDGLVNVRVLESVQEYLEEGVHMHHCVYDGNYYLRENSLVLSATINDKRIETIEISLETLKILQCYGACNKFTEHHNRIIELVNRNAYLIGQRISA